MSQIDHGITDWANKYCDTLDDLRSFRIQIDQLRKNITEHEAISASITDDVCRALFDAAFKEDLVEAKATLDRLEARLAELIAGTTPN